MTRALEVVQPGPLALLQDEGRPGYAAIGVGHSGAADRAAYRLGGRLVGHEPGLAAVEVVFGGLRVRASGDLTICLTGAPCPATIDTEPVATAAPLLLRDGAELVLEPPETGLRTYLTVRGGIDVPAELGSRSTDVLAGLGPARLETGDLLPVATSRAGFPGVDVAPVRPPAAGVVTLPVLAGPRRGWMRDPADLVQQQWTVSARSDRVGVRLEGTPLARSAEHDDQELPSEGLVRGCVQLPHGGQPVVFLADHPVTGGYPVIGVLPEAAADRAAQLRPGQPVRWRWVG